MALHEALGPGRTTISAIAERAGVERLTVYRHFPDEPALFAACSGHYGAAHPAPDPAGWQALADPAARTGAALRAIYRYLPPCAAHVRARAARRRGHPCAPRGRGGGIRRLPGRRPRRPRGRVGAPARATPDARRGARPCPSLPDVAGAGRRRPEGRGDRGADGKDDQDSADWRERFGRLGSDAHSGQEAHGFARRSPSGTRAPPNPEPANPEPANPNPRTCEPENPRTPEPTTDSQSTMNSVAPCSVCDRCGATSEATS